MTTAARIALDTFRQSASFVRRQPRFTAVVVLAIGVGIGANSALFAVINSLFLRPLPYDRPHELVEISLPDRHPAVRDLGTARSFSGVAAYIPWGFIVTEPNGVQNAFGMRVSPNLFEVLGVRPAFGRVFSASDDRHVVMLSYQYWQRISGDPQIVGGMLTVAGQPHNVVGILPPDFVLWFRDMTIFVPDTPENGRLVGRLTPGVTTAQALAEVQGIVKSAGAPATTQPSTTQVTPFSEAFRSTDANTMLMLQLTVAMVLLITCANIGNLLLVRSSARKREFAIRTAIGAGRARLFGQLMGESVLLAAMGAAVGLLLASWSLDVLGAQLPAGVSRTLRGADALSIDFTVVAFTVGITAVTVLLVGLAPAVVGLRTDLISTLRDSSKGTTPGRQRFGRALVIGEIALALTLLIGSALIFKSLIGLENRDLGFNAARVLRAAINLQPYEWTPEQRVAAVADIVARCKALPGVESVGLLSPQVFPFGGPRVRGAVFAIQGRDDGTPRAEVYVADADYFRAVRIPLLKGRLFSDADTASSTPVAIISDVVATRYWGASDPLGSIIRLRAEDPASPWVTVIGVVGDVRNPTGADVQPTAYRPYAQSPATSAVLMIRTSIEADLVTDTVRRTLTDNLRDGGPVRVNNLERGVNAYISPQRFTTSMVGFFAVLGLLLAGLGVYAVMRNWVSVRTFEFGVRMALGAQRGDIARLVLRSAGTTAAIGVALGIAGALALQRIVASQLHGVSPTDPAVFAAVSVFMAVVALTAGFLPARSAMRVDAAVALRQE